ncbi:MAG: hypothetical protein P4L55_08365 [Syntrophobacteraceae bacterium]|nr:hypothetical protein [Syntrophobacteraceae bacterium]
MTPQPTRNCNTCTFSKRMCAKQKGVRVPGGFRKCIHPYGPAACNPIEVAKGIGGNTSNYKEKNIDRKGTGNADR